MTQRLRSPFFHPIQRLGVSAPTGGLQVGCAVNVRHGGLELRNGPCRTVATRPAAGAIKGGVYVITPLRRDQAVLTIAKVNPPRQMIQHIMTVTRAGTIEIGRLMPTHPNFFGATAGVFHRADRIGALLLAKDGSFNGSWSLWFAHFELGCEQHGCAGRLENLVRLAIAGPQVLMLDCDRLAGPGGVG